MANILAVDDDRDLCTLLKTALERDGHTVETRTSGTQLTDTLCRWADCILLDLSAKEASVGGTPLHLTKSEYAICELLALHAGQTFSKEQIYEAVFGYDGTADDTAIAQHIKNIRAKLRAAGAGEVLQTIWGVGYQWQNEN